MVVEPDLNPTSTFLYFVSKPFKSFSNMLLVLERPTGQNIGLLNPNIVSRFLSKPSVTGRSCYGSGIHPLDYITPYLVAVFKLRLYFDDARCLLLY